MWFCMEGRGGLPGGWRRVLQKTHWRHFDGTYFGLKGRWRKFRFFEPDRFGRNGRLSGSAEDSISEDRVESFRAVALGNKAAEEGIKSYFFISSISRQTEDLFGHADNKAVEYARRMS